MAGICCGTWISPILQPRVRANPGLNSLSQKTPHLLISSSSHRSFHPSPKISCRVHGFRCAASKADETPSAVKIAVSGVTELLRFFSLSTDRLESVDYTTRDEVSVSGVDDVLTILRSDYDNAYFVTGVFTSAIYAEDCIFEDPTIKFRGKGLYLRNLKLLVPFFDCPTVKLEKIEKGINSRTSSVSATWKLRTYLKLPWRPLVSVDGNTTYDLDDEFKIIRHTESWNISALEAVGQIFILSFQRPLE